MINTGLIVFLVNPDENAVTRAMQQIIKAYSEACPTCAQTFAEHEGLPMHCPTCDRTRGLDWQRNLIHRAEALLRTSPFMEV